MQSSPNRSESERTTTRPSPCSTTAASGASGGAAVDEVTAYRTVLVVEDVAPLAERLAAGDVDVATFASSSTVRNLCQALGPRAALLDRVKTVCIGPVTASAARELGLRVDAVADEHTVEGLVAAVERVVARADAAELVESRA